MNNSLSHLGPHFIVGLKSTTLLDQEKRDLERLKPSGIIIFKHNLAFDDPEGWIEKLHALFKSAKEASEGSCYLFSVDHEGGRVHRFPPPVTKFKAACHWKDNTQAVACAMANELKALGCNLSYAPVLDVFSEPANTVIGDRALGKTPEEVSKYAPIYIHSLHEEGVVACGKHFPGHGATIADSHFELPKLDVPLEVIEERELPPFISAINAGVQMMMTAHVVYPALDKEFPSTISKTIITGLLREKLGYSKVVITDDSEMKALGGLSLEERAVKSIGAGVDMLLVGNPKDAVALDRAIEMAEGIKKAIESKSLTIKQIEASQERISNLKSFTFSIAKESPQLSVIGCEKHSSLAMIG